MVTLIIAPAERALLARHGLDGFDALWEASVIGVEAPNSARGGTSEVGVLELGAGADRRRYYLKRQRNFNCRTPRHWLRGIPLAQREWLGIHALARIEIPTLEAIAFGRDRRPGDDRALLLTRALDAYLDLDTWLAQTQKAAPREHFAAAAGALLGQLHAAGWRHGCLYPKHLFVARDAFLGDDGSQNPVPLCLIDLEKCKRTWQRWGSLRDLDTLFRHCPALDPGLRETLLDAYSARRGLRLERAALARRIARSKG
ncbi:MAG: lipopolysaccharide kinase InaA family protein [Porticoccaceae bacterium]